MLKEPSNDNRLSRVLSSIFSNLSIPLWHEGSSTGVSAMETTLFSRGSHSTSITSFNLTDSPSKSLDDGRCSDAPEVEQRLSQSPINAEQADAHVPPPSPTLLKSRFSDYSDLIDDDESIGEICFVSSSRTAETNKILAPAARARSVSESLSWYRAFCEAHPEYDSDLDRDTNTAESFMTWPLEDDAESGAGHETSASNIPTPSPDPLPHSIPYEIIPTPPPSSFLPTPPPPPCYIRPCIFSTRAAPLSDKEARTSHKHDQVLSGTCGQKSLRTKSGVQRFLSIILPCIPVVTKETERLDEKDGCRRQQDGARGPKVTKTANDRHLTGSKENHGKKAGKKRSCTTLFW